MTVFDLETIHVSDDDVILIKSDRTLSIDEFMKLKDVLVKKAKNILIINCKSGMVVENLPEKEMNKHGWFRK